MDLYIYQINGSYLIQVEARSLNEAYTRAKYYQACEHPKSTGVPYFVNKLKAIVKLDGEVIRPGAEEVTHEEAKTFILKRTLPDMWFKGYHGQALVWTETQALALRFSAEELVVLKESKNWQKFAALAVEEVEVES